MSLAVFDLDGTLVDTAPDLVDATNIVLKEHGVPPVAAEVLRPHIGLGARRMIEVSLREAGRTMSEAELSAVHREFFDHYATRFTRYSRPFPEMLAALDALEAAGVTLAVCTNKRERSARAVLGELHLAERFAAIAGQDTFAAMKPDPRHLTETIRLAGGALDRAVFVGDSTVDYDTAAAAGIPFVGVTFGYSVLPMEQLRPDRLVGPGGDVAAAVISLLF